MDKKIVKPKIFQTTIGPYSLGIQIQDLIYTSGQVGIGPKTGKIYEGIVE